jgi:hypothetical protein
MQRTFVRFNAFVLSLGVALHAFDGRLATVRTRSTVQPDSLVHYNMLLTWWRHGDSVRGFTLTPSPYFIDMLVQLPIVLLAPDFERFSYWLAFVYASLIFVALYVVLRIALRTSDVIAIAVAGVALAGFYTLSPYDVVVHVFVVNHTSESFTTLGMLALVNALFRPDAGRRPYAPILYCLALALCVASSPFFIATYCIPSALAMTAIVGTEYMARRRLAWFIGLTAIGTLAGLISLALVSRYVWPVRVDSYMRWWKSYLAFKQTLADEPGGMRAAWATAIAFAASCALALVARRRRWSPPLTCMLAFFPAATLACIVLPIKRGAFAGFYEFRYLQLPWLLTITFYTALVARSATALATRLLRGRRWPRMPPGSAWCAAVLGAAGIAFVATRHGAMTMSEPASFTAPAIACFRDAESKGLKDGLATWAMARYLNAARHAAGWESPHVIVELLDRSPPVIEPRENNLVWFDGGFRRGQGTLNFLSTHMLRDHSLAFFRERIGPPDRTITCPAPVNIGGGPKFELWIWDQPEAQQRLADFVIRNNERSPFTPIIGAKTMSIDLAWGGGAGDYPHDKGLVGTHREWHRGPDPEDRLVMMVVPMWLPSGRYRIDLDVTSLPSSNNEPAAEIVVREERTLIGRFPIDARTRHAVVEFDVDNRGGPTSGEIVGIDVMALSAESIELDALTLTLVEARGIRPFQIFH